MFRLSQRVAIYSSTNYDNTLTIRGNPEDIMGRYTCRIGPRSVSSYYSVSGTWVIILKGELIIVLCYILFSKCSLPKRGCLIEVHNACFMLKMILSCHRNKTSDCSKKKRLLPLQYSISFTVRGGPVSSIGMLQ